MVLKDIYIYPVKSLGGVRLGESEVLERGLRLDRRWMLTDKNGRFLTQRGHPQMALLQVEPGPEGLTVFHKNHPSERITIPYRPLTDSFTTVVVWDDTVEAQLVSEEISRWFSARLGIPCELVFMEESASRKLKPKYAVNGESVSFADGMPYLLISRASLDDLNSRLSSPVPMNRFRPNLVIEGASPFAEDSWKEIRIGSCLFRITKACARCVVTTTDQETGQRSKEPLRTLSGYRKNGTDVLFGQNMLLLEGNRIRTGDAVEVIRHQQPSP